MSKGCIVLAAGGTGGHLFPAEALAHTLIARGYTVQLVTDERARKLADDFPAEAIHVVRSATTASRSPVAIWKTAIALFVGYRQSKAIMANAKPKAVVGFGGYPTLPPMMAACRTGLATLVHEQNAVLGRTNRLLAKRVDCVAVGFKQVGEIPKVKIVETGNPVRPMVDAVKDASYPSRRPTDRLRLVIFGGSQGARFFSEILPAALALVPKAALAKFSILQQARQEDEANLKEAYKKLGVKADIAPFFKNMPGEIAKAHLVIGRAGASTVTELAVIGRPSLLVPLPGSLDGDQAKNALAMRQAGGAEVIKQSDLTPQRLADFLQKTLANPAHFWQMAKAAKKTGIADGAARLADCVESVISGNKNAK